ncbi:MAG: hypothetical protein HC917_06355 [Richelia sp. SM2_1_7]|nr:hypothetical protein [Richelia sp. SM2_1_7]
MATRGLIRIFDDKDKPLVCCYNHLDSYPEELGQELANFLSEFEIINGITFDTSNKKANGMKCLAAQLIAYFKLGIGRFYIYPIDTKDAGQEYEYHIKLKDNKIILSCPEIEFEGYPKDFKNYLDLYNKKWDIEAQD